MAKNLTEVDTYTANVVVPEEGDDATALSVEVAAQDMTDRIKFLLEHIKYLSSLDNTTGSRVSTKGVKHVRLLADIAALQAVVGGAGVDGECAYVDSVDGLYVYNSASSTAADGNWVVQPSSGGGRWFRHDYALLNVANGIPRLDGSTKIPVTQLTNRLVSVETKETGLTNSDDSAAFDTENNTNFQLLGDGNHALTVTPVVGDILVIDAFLRAKTTSAGDPGEVMMRVDGVEFSRQRIYNTNPQNFHFHAKYVAVDTSVTIEFLGREPGGGVARSACTHLSISVAKSLDRKGASYALCSTQRSQT